MLSARFIQRLVAALFVLVLFPSVEVPHANCEFIPPENVEVHTENYTPQTYTIPQGTYYYEIHWEGVPVASAQISVNLLSENEHKSWEVKIKATSSSVVSIFYTLEFSGRAVFNADDYRPSFFSTEQLENGRHSGREITFNSDGTISSVRSRKGKPSEKVSFNPHNLLFDPISATFFVRSLAFELGRPMTVDIYNSKHRYLVSFSPSKIEQLTVAKQTYQAWNLVPSVIRLTDSEPEKRVRKANVWISNDEKRLILRFVSEVWIGKVTADLISFAPSNI